MVCNNYKPVFQDQINSYDPLGSLNCTCYSGAMAGDYHTCGGKRPTGKRVRELTGDRSGGTTLPQVDYALNKGWAINLDTRIGSARLTWSEFEAKINSGRAAILQGSYKVIAPTRFSGSPTFTGNHALLVLPNWIAMDPLCDGRRPGIYKYHGEAYPKDLLKRFAGELVLNTRYGTKLGYGRVWCSLTRDNTEAWKCSIHPLDGQDTRVFATYFVNSEGVIYKRGSKRTGGFTATCTPPRYYRAKSGLGYAGKSLVRITSGFLKDTYISSGYAREA